MERASGEEQLGTVDEVRRLISEVKEEEDHDEGDNGVPSKHVHFDAMELGPRSSMDAEATPPTESFGVNSHAQHSEEVLHVATTSNAVRYLAETTENDGVGGSVEHSVDPRSIDGRSIEDKAGIILVGHSTSCLPILP